MIDQSLSDETLNMLEIDLASLGERVAWYAERAMKDPTPWALRDLRQVLMFAADGTMVLETIVRQERAAQGLRDLPAAPVHHTRSR